MHQEYWIMQMIGGHPHKVASWPLSMVRDAGKHIARLRKDQPSIKSFVRLVVLDEVVSSFERLPDDAPELGDIPPNDEQDVGRTQDSLDQNADPMQEAYRKVFPE